MDYLSTRGQTAAHSASQAILKGLADDGGLFVPNAFPSLEMPSPGSEYLYPDLAYSVMEPCLSDYPKATLKNILEQAYRRFNTAEVVPLARFGRLAFLELYHGPTLAFKDVALTVLPYLMKEAQSIQKRTDKVLILTATSGDTGKAALEGFRDVEGTEVVVFYPEEGVSYLQKQQMQTQEGKNTHVFGIRGNFDDAQRGVKELFSSPAFTAEMAKDGYQLSSANSINLGRLLPQIVYYVHGYLQLLIQKVIQPGESINLVVPSGNFGNLLAAYYAGQMGLPIHRWICASNENQVLTDFFTTGRYDARRTLVKTSSPSMDILVSSNLERYLYHESGGNSERVQAAMQHLKHDGCFHWPVTDHRIFAAMADENEVSLAINQMAKAHGYILDPHTAVGYAVYQKYLNQSGDDRPVLIASTASPFKFAGKVLNALGHSSDSSEYVNLKKLAAISGWPLPVALAELQAKPIRHHAVVDKNGLEQAVRGALHV